MRAGPRGRPRRLAGVISASSASSPVASGRSATNRIASRAGTSPSVVIGSSSRSGRAGAAATSSTIGPNSVFCSARSSRRRTSSSAANRVTTRSVRETLTARTDWRMTRPVSPRASRRTRICCPTVISRGHDLGRWRLRLRDRGQTGERGGQQTRVEGGNRRLGQVGQARLAVPHGRDVVARRDVAGRVADGAVHEQAAAELLLVDVLGTGRQLRARLGGEQAAGLDQDELRGDGHELGEVGAVDRMRRQVASRTRRPPRPARRCGCRARPTRSGAGAAAGALRTPGARPGTRAAVPRRAHRPGRAGSGRQRWAACAIRMPRQRPAMQPRAAHRCRPGRW